MYFDVLNRDVHDKYRKIMPISLLICATFLLLKIIVSQPIPVSKQVASTISKNVPKSNTVSDTIENLARTYEADLEPESNSGEELKLQARVTVTYGYTTFWEWLKSWVILGYQPELYGSNAWPLTQYVFDRAYGLFPGMTTTTIQPANSNGYVKEPSHYLNPGLVNQLKETVAQIWEDLRKSDHKIPIV